MAKKSRKITKAKIPEKFTIVIDQPSYWKAVWEAMDSIFDELLIKVTKNGMEWIDFDTSRVCVVYGVLSRTFFSDFDVGKDFEFRIAVRDLVKVNKRVRQRDKYVLSYSEKDRKLSVVLESGKTKRRFRLGTISDFERTDLQFDDLKLIPTAKFHVEPEIVAELVKDIEIYSEDVTITATEENVCFEASGESGDLLCELDINPDVTEKARASYLIRRLAQIMKILPIAWSCEIEFKEQAPMIFTFKTLRDGSFGSDTICTFKYILAPKSESEEIDDLEDFDELDELPDEFEDENVNDSDVERGDETD